MTTFSPEQQERIEELVVAAQAGDTEAFAELYDLFVQPVYRYVYYRVPSSEVEDILENVFLRIWENLKKYKRQKGKGSFSSWLFRVAHNLIADFYRGQKEPPLELDYDIPDDDRIHSPLRYTQNKLNNAHLQEALGKLNESHQQLIVLKFINEFSNKEICKIMGKSEGGLRILQFRALKALRDVLTEMGIES